MTPKCHATGCKRKPTWECRRLYGKGGTFHACDQHKPGSKPSSNPAVRALVARRPFYEVKPLADA